MALTNVQNYLTTHLPHKILQGGFGLSLVLHQTETERFKIQFNPDLIWVPYGWAMYRLIIVITI